MGALDLLHRALDRGANLPPLRQIRRAAFDRWFASGRAAHAFRGCFTTYEEALASAPASLPVGYDNPASAAMYLSLLHVVDHDYPALFWLAQSLHGGMRNVADLGGSVGIKYYAFRTQLEYPVDMRWSVIEVPAVVRRGREFALSQRAGPALAFSDSFATADGADLLLASGSLQYLPRSLPDMLDELERKPRRLLINATPIHPERTYFTLNSIGTAFCAYRVQSRAAFLDGLEARGYRLRAEWNNLAKPLNLPFDPGCSLEHYSGFCFDRDA